MNLNKIAIITCSTSGLDYIRGYDDIRKARTTIIFEGQELLDGLEIHPDEFYNRIDKIKDVPKTSQPSMGQLLEIYEELKNEGYTDAIYISISEHLSGTYQGVCLSRDLIEDFTIHPFNSKTASFLGGFMAMEAYKMANEGKSVSEILEYLEKLSDNDRIFFMVDDLKYLVRNGRLSNAQGFIASALKIKPLLEVDSEGKIVAKEKIRTTKKALERVVESFLQDTNNGKDAKFIFLFNTQAKESLEYTKKLLEDHGIDTKNLIDGSISPAIGCHVGKGVVGIGYIKNVE